MSPCHSTKPQTCKFYWSAVLKEMMLLPLDLFLAHILEYEHLGFFSHNENVIFALF
jgi:hypothetical protein